MRVLKSILALTIIIGAPVTLGGCSLQANEETRRFVFENSAASRERIDDPRWRTYSR